VRVPEGNIQEALINPIKQSKRGADGSISKTSIHPHGFFHKSNIRRKKEKRSQTSGRI
jgi:hypothetical protein